MHRYPRSHASGRSRRPFLTGQRVLSTLIGLLLMGSVAWSAEVRVATYNIKFLSTNVQQEGDRLAKLREVIDLLDADVIGLQEIADRAALALVFPPQEWHLVIDDDSADAQDVALAVRKPFSVLGLPPDLDADDPHFLFSSASNDLFPNRRDVLAVEVQVPNDPATFVVMVIHAKSRVGGRASTDARREDAARALVRVLERDFDDKDVILLGDFNDNPDDRSLNILETGDPNAPAGPEEIEGPFLLNLTEPLVAADQVSFGRGPSDVVGEVITTTDPGSRARNNQARGTNANTGDILFDQILIPVRMRDRYVSGSITIFNHRVALKGTAPTRASDHLPVSATFVFGGTAPVPDSPVAVRIVALLPNPDGEDAGREQVTLGNGSPQALSLTGWKLQDRAGNQFLLTGTVPAQGTLLITMQEASMPLNNSGDDVSLLDPQGRLQHHVSYPAAAAQPGNVVTFARP